MCTAVCTAVFTARVSGGTVLMTEVLPHPHAEPGPETQVPLHLAGAQVQVAVLHPQRLRLLLGPTDKQTNKQTQQGATLTSTSSIITLDRIYYFNDSISNRALYYTFCTTRHSIVRGGWMDGWSDHTDGVEGVAVILNICF